MTVNPTFWGTYDYCSLDLGLVYYKLELEFALVQPEYDQQNISDVTVFWKYLVQEHLLG